MKAVRNHRWDVTPDEAESIQRELAELVEVKDRIRGDIRLIGGLDVAYETNGDRVFAAVVVMDLESQETIETAVEVGMVTFPYVPGLFSFRELPPLCKALSKLQTSPDLLICDGQGLAHPRRFGLASHVGVLFDVPTIGCGKSCLIGKYSELRTCRGSLSPLCDRSDVIGAVVRTQTDVKPLYVSIGHRIELDTACQWILRLADQYRQPEPIRRVNQLTNEERSRFLGLL